MAVGTKTNQQLSQFVGNLLIKHNGRTPDKELAKLIKEEFPNLNRDAAQMAKIISGYRSKLNNGSLKYTEHTITEQVFPAPAKPIKQHGAPDEKPAKVKTEKAPKAAPAKPVAPKKGFVLKKPAKA